MKIGTITYWWSQTNYGQVLQCYALLKFLRMRGHDAFLIKFHEEKQKNNYRTKILKLLWFLINPLKIYKWFRTRKLWNEIKLNEKEDANVHPRYFDKFREKYIPSTSIEYTYSLLQEQPPLADAYICGSDQIWGGDKPIYYLQFGKPEVLRIAYAPSFGGLHPKGLVKRRILNYISGFNFLSSREKGGVDFLKENGFSNVELVPDPTLLLPSEIYRQMESNNVGVHEHPYIFVYLLGNPTSVSIEDIQQFARKEGLKIKYVAAQGKIDTYEKIYPQVEEWLECIDKAKYVVTNSFHGTVFSLILNTPFLTLPVVGGISRMNNRIYDLLNNVNMLNRIYQNSLDELLAPVDFGFFNDNRKVNQDRIVQLFSKIGL